MSKLFSPLAIAGAFASLTLLGTAPGLAAPLVTFVSGKGTDTGNCADPAHPCRSFQFAIDQTSPGGEVNALEPAHYGRTTITKSISIIGVEGAGRILNNATDAITINAGPNDTIKLSQLTLDGVKTAVNGIVLNSGGSLGISHCTVRNFAGSGIELLPTTNTAFLIADTAAANNNGDGILVAPQGSGSARGTLDHVSVNENGTGIGIGGQATVLAVDSTAANNRASGFDVTSPAVLRLAHSAAIGNFNGVDVRRGTAGTAESAGNNFFRGNGTNVRGTLDPVGTQ